MVLILVIVRRQVAQRLLRSSQSMGGPKRWASELLVGRGDSGDRRGGIEAYVLNYETT